MDVNASDRYSGRVLGQNLQTATARLLLLIGLASVVLATLTWFFV